MIKESQWKKRSAGGSLDTTMPKRPRTKDEDEDEHESDRTLRDGSLG
jgi:hypothetical protein